MTFNWKEFYNVGIHLKQHSPKEAYQRSATGRLYYATFNLTKQYYEQKYHILGHHNPHHTLIQNLKNKNNRNEVKISKLLYNLRILRNYADYEQHFKQENCDKSLKLANQILYLLEELEK